MNIIIFPRPRTRFTYVTNLRGWDKIGEFLGLIIFSTVLLGGGYALGVSLGHKAILSEWKIDIIEQKERLHTVKQESQTQIDALTTKVGSLQVHVNRIDALGNMLVSMANIDAEELSFDSTPGIGGPHLGIDSDTQVDMKIGTTLAKIDTELEKRERQLQVLNDLLMDQKIEQETYPQGRPVIHGWISSYFGKRQSPFTGKFEMHRGIDFAGRPGSDVIAVAGGIVSRASKDGSYGFLVEIDHGNGHATRYGHNQMPLVQAGEAIKRGQVIAKLGSTGRSTGPHVHFEILKDGVQVDPMPYVQ